MCYTQRRKNGDRSVSAHLQFQGKNLCTNTWENCDLSFDDGSGNSSIHRLKLFYIAKTVTCKYVWCCNKKRRKWRYQTGNDLVNNTWLCVVYGICIKRPFNVILNIFVPDFKHIAHRCVLFFMLMLLPLLVLCYSHCLFSGFQVPPHSASPRFCIIKSFAFAFAFVRFWNSTNAHTRARNHFISHKQWEKTTSETDWLDTL